MLRIFFYTLISLSLLGIITFTWSYNASNPLFWGVALSGEPDKGALTQVTDSTGLKPKIVVFFTPWQAQTGEFHFPKDTLESIFDFGAVPCWTWEPFYMDKDRKVNVLSKDIVEGVHDDYLRFIAKGLKAITFPIIIRFGHEMNLNSYHWGVEESHYNEKTPEQYVLMFRYVVDFFRRESITHILWAFCPNADSVPDESWNDPRAYYPGDSYVNILGMDGYNWGYTQPPSRPRPFVSIFSSLYHTLKSLSSSKPIFVFETASVPNSNREEWIDDAIDVSKKWGILAFVWFNIKKENDWRVALTPKQKDIFSEKSFVEVLEALNP